MAKRWNFPKVIQRVKAFKRSVPVKIAGIMKRHFEDGFRKGGFTDATFNPWKARKRPDAGRAILVKSGDLRDSIHIRTSTFNIIRVGSYGIDYAHRHNRGLKGMPKRQFIGPSRAMTKKIVNLINLEIRKTFR